MALRTRQEYLKDLATNYVTSNSLESASKLSKCSNLHNILTLNLLKFLIGIIHLQFSDQSIMIFRDTKMRIWKFVIQQYRAWSDCTALQTGLALYWWQRLITFGSSRIWVNTYFTYLRPCLS